MKSKKKTNNNNSNNCKVEWANTPNVLVDQYSINEVMLKEKQRIAFQCDK